MNVQWETSHVIPLSSDLFAVCLQIEHIDEDGPSFYLEPRRVFYLAAQHATVPDVAGIKVPQRFERTAAMMLLNDEFVAADDIETESEEFAECVFLGFHEGSEVDFRKYSQGYWDDIAKHYICKNYHDHPDDECSTADDTNN